MLQADQDIVPPQGVTLCLTEHHQLGLKALSSLLDLVQAVQGRLQVRQLPVHLVVRDTRPDSLSADEDVDNQHCRPGSQGCEPQRPHPTEHP